MFQDNNNTNKDRLNTLSNSTIEDQTIAANGSALQTVNVIIAEDHLLFIEGLKSVLKQSEKFDFNIMNIANTGPQLEEMLKTADVELLLLDLNMPEKDGLNVLADIKGKYKDLKILALTNYDEVKLVKSAFKSGVDGYILKNIGIHDLHNAIDVVMDGRTYVGEGVELVNNGIKPLTPEMKAYQDKFLKKYNLTKREMEILSLIAQALSNKEIASELYISDQTVSVHRKNIMRKLGVSNAAALIKIAYENDLI